MPARKRTRHEASLEDEVPTARAEPTLLERIRNMSEFAAFMQYLFIFGRAMKVEDVSIEDFEQECIKPGASQKVTEIGLALLKNISSHRGLNLDLFDEYTRRQYVAKAPDRNPFGVDEEPNKFDDFDIFTKIRILHQLSIWTFWNPDRMRDKFSEVSFDEQAADWRMDPYGWDSTGRTYFLLDDDRLYRLTDPPTPEPARKKQKPRARGGRSSTRRRVSRVVESTPEEEPEEMEGVELQVSRGLEFEENFEGRKWECIAVSLEDFQTFIDTIRKSGNRDERNLSRRLQENVIQHLLNKEEDRQREEAKRLKELENLQRLATAKRSSRIAHKLESRREQEEADEAERKRLADLEMARKEQQRQHKMEEDRQSRMMTREQRLKEREVKRILNEETLRKEQEQLEQLTKEEANGPTQNGRISQRQLKADVEKRQKELQVLQSEEDDWMFDCAVCGVHGPNLDDGSHSIACEKCNVWQHSSCHGIDKEQAERDDFHFICKDCKYKMENPRPPLKIKLSLGEAGAAVSPSSGAEKSASTSKPRQSNIKKVKKNDKAGDSPKPRPSKSSTPKAKSKLPNASPNGHGGLNSTAGAAGLTVISPVPVPAPRGPLVYPGPPPPAPHVNARPPSSNGPNPNQPPVGMFHSTPASATYHPHSSPYRHLAPTPGSEQSPRPYISAVHQPPQSNRNALPPPASYQSSNGYNAASRPLNISANGYPSSPFQYQHQHRPPAPTPSANQYPPYSSFQASQPQSSTPSHHPPAAPSPQSQATPIPKPPYHVPQAYDARPPAQSQYAHQLPRMQPMTTPKSATSASDHAPQPSPQLRTAQTPIAQTLVGVPSTTTHPVANPLHLPQPLSSPPQALSTPRPTYQTNPALSGSESALQGSSPGYSPVKHPSPPRRSPATQSFGNPIVPPVALSPVQQPNITSPPVKNPSPPAPKKTNHVTVASLVD